MAHNVQRPHDKLFRTVFADPAEAAALLRAHLPQSLASDLKSVKTCARRCRDREVI